MCDEVGRECDRSSIGSEARRMGSRGDGYVCPTLFAMVSDWKFLVDRTTDESPHVGPVNGQRNGRTTIGGALVSIRTSPSTDGKESDGRFSKAKCVFHGREKSSSSEQLLHAPAAAGCYSGGAHQVEDQTSHRPPSSARASGSRRRRSKVQFERESTESDARCSGGELSTLLQ